MFAFGLNQTNQNTNFSNQSSDRLSDGLQDWRKLSAWAKFWDKDVQTCEETSDWGCGSGNRDGKILIRDPLYGMEKNRIRDINQGSATFVTPFLFSLPVNNLCHKGLWWPCLFKRSNIYHQLIMTFIRVVQIWPLGKWGAGSVTCDPDKGRISRNNNVRYLIFANIARENIQKLQKCSRKFRQKSWHKFSQKCAKVDIPLVH